MTDEDYYRHRMYEELAAAERSSSSCTALIHEDMASRYRALLNGEAGGLNGAFERHRPAGAPVVRTNALAG